VRAKLPPLDRSILDEQFVEKSPFHCNFNLEELV
jgi:hypothetical protein